jgi:hypothetical protein
MIILEYMILVGVFVLIYGQWVLYYRSMAVSDIQNELVQALQEQFLVIATREELNHYFEAVKLELDKSIRNIQIENDKRHIVMHDRFDDIQRSLLSKVDFEKYQKELRDKESLINEAQKKLKENRNKSLRIAFGGKDDE